MGAYLCLRKLSGQAELYRVPAEYTYGGQWARPLTQDQEDECVKYLKGPIGLNQEGDDIIIGRIFMNGNPYSWFKNLKNNSPDPVFNFANNVLGLGLQRSEAPSALHTKRLKKQRTK
jgi:hypothetical protein